VEKLLHIRSTSDEGSLERSVEKKYQFYYKEEERSIEDRSTKKKEGCKTLEVVALQEGIEFEDGTFFVTGVIVFILGSGSKGDSTKSLSQTFKSRERQMTKEGLTATLLGILKILISLFRNPSKRKENRRDSEQNPLAKQLTFQPWEIVHHKGAYFSNLSL